MNESFFLNVFYRQEDVSFEGKLLVQGFTYRIVVSIDNNEVYFEPDESGGYRAVRMPGQNQDALEKIDPELLRLLADRLEAIMA